MQIYPRHLYTYPNTHSNTHTSARPECRQTSKHKKESENRKIEGDAKQIIIISHLASRISAMRIFADLELCKSLFYRHFSKLRVYCRVPCIMLGIYSIYIWYIYCTIKAFSVMGLTVYKQIKDKITFNLSSIQRSLCQLTVQKTDKSDRDQFERGQRRERRKGSVASVERGAGHVERAESACYSYR